MKTTIRFSLFLTAFFIILFSGCEPTEGDTPSDDVRDPYIGVWQFVESFKSTEGQSYIVTISKDPNNSSQVVLENFGNPGASEITVVGMVTSNQIVITEQSLSNGWTVEGSGKITNVNKTSMTWAYTILAGGGEDTYTATATKQ